MKKIIFLSLFALVFAGAGCMQPPAAPADEQPAEEVGGGAGLANPASSFCVEQGGTVEIRDGEAGQYGICVFPDGRACEEWAYFRGECSLDDEAGTCVNKCGDSVCQTDISCDVTGCPCVEDETICSLDCGIELPE